MSKRPVRRGHQAILEGKNITSQRETSIRSDQPNCRVVIDSDASATINPGVEVETGLFRPRLHWISGE
jgi:hypothetical protein